ncbi:MAG: hypothetical protein U1A28_00635 [Patescibacteria group bacterium]|nr:hypothetical protein [Patescibacteria group bacterium]
MPCSIRTIVGIDNHPHQGERAMLITQSWSGGATTHTGFYHTETGVILLEEKGKPSMSDFYCYDGTVKFEDKILWFSIEVWRGGGETPVAPPVKDPWGLLGRFSVGGVYGHFAHGVETRKAQDTKRYAITFWRGCLHESFAPPGLPDLQRHLSFALTALDGVLQREWEHVRDYSRAEGWALV